MERFANMIRWVIILLCMALFAAGAVWNLCFPQERATVQPSEQETQPETAEVLLQKNENAQLPVQLEAEEANQRIAALRIQRDTGWQQLYHAVEQLEFDQKQQTLRQYAELQHQEQRLELLLSAKSVEQCLAVLTPTQANIIVPEAILQQEYEKLFDLVLRNTTYDETQIVLVPLR